MPTSFPTAQLHVPVHVLDRECQYRPKMKVPDQNLDRDQQHFHAGEDLPPDKNGARNGNHPAGKGQEPGLGGAGVDFDGVGVAAGDEDE